VQTDHIDIEARNRRDVALEAIGVIRRRMVAASL